MALILLQLIEREHLLVMILFPLTAVMRCRRTYPAPVGRNFAEIIRCVDALQMVVNHKCATTVDWNDGKDCVVLPSVSTEDAKKLFPKGVNEVRPWLRMTPDPR